jgi:hydrogenase nickel incorporation protein HypA/HybF
MHELYVTKSIFQIVLKHATIGNVSRVISVNLEIGALSDLQAEWIQRYFDRLSRDTVVEGAKLHINRKPVVFQCNCCQQSFEINSRFEKNLSCPHCRANEIILVSGREYHVKNMEVM